MSTVAANPPASTTSNGDALPASSSAAATSTSGSAVSTTASGSAAGNGMDDSQIYQWILELSSPETRENALLELR